MNFLGHAYLSFGHHGLLAGNMIGDYVKGRLILDSLPTDLRNGVLLHRSIDSYADEHPATQRAKLLFRESYGLYSGAIMDTLYDHFLANDPAVFSSQGQLKQFSDNVYDILDAHQPQFPARFAAMLPYMRDQDWLTGYRNVKGMERALNGLYRRAKYMPSPETAFAIFTTSYYQLNQCYYEFIDDIRKHAKSRLLEMGYEV